MVTVLDTVTAALSSGINPIAALREITGYSLEQLSVASGFALSDLADLETANTVDPDALGRITSALGLPCDIVS